MPLIEYHRHTNIPRAEPDPFEGRRVWLNEVIESGRTDHTRADSKAALLIVIPSAGLALGSGRLDDLPLLATVFGWAAALTATTAVVLLTAIVWPRVGETPGMDKERLLAAAHARASPEVDLMYRAEEAARLGQITLSKYRLLRIAIGALGAGTLLALIAAMLA